MTVTGQQESRLNECLKRLHDAEDEIRIVSERGRYAQRVFELGMVNDYPSGKSAFLFEVLPRIEIDDIWGAVNRGESRTILKLAILVYGLNSIDIPARQNRDKQPMFVDIVQSVYGPNGVIPSAIRAYLVKEEIAQVGIESMDGGVFLSRSMEPTFKLFDLFSNGELGSVRKNFRDKSLGGLVPNMIQSTIKVVEGIPNHEGQIIKDFGICELMYESFRTKFRVNLDSGGFRFMKRHDACFDVLDMSIGPFDLEPGIFAEGHSVSSDCGMIAP
jgi:hypothetical protein